MKRDKFIKVRVSADELAEIKGKAEKTMMNLSDYVRTSAVKEKIILYDTEHIFRFEQELHSIGNNINQIAMVANSTKSIYRQDIQDLTKQVKEMSERFRKYIRSLKCEEM